MTGIETLTTGIFATVSILSTCQQTSSLQAAPVFSVLISLKNWLKKIILSGPFAGAINFPAYIPKEIFDRVEWVEGDILDVVSLEEAMEGIDYRYTYCRHGFIC